MELDVSTINIFKKRHETEKLIAAEHNSVKQKLDYLKNQINEEKKKILNLETRVTALANESANISTKIEQNKINTRETQEKFMQMDLVLDKCQIKKLRAGMISLKEENTLHTYNQKMDNYQIKLNLYCNKVNTDKIAETTQEKNNNLQNTKKNLILEMGTMRSSNEVEKKKLQLEIKITTHRVEALKRKLNKKSVIKSNHLECMK